LKVTISIGLAHYPNPKISSKKDLITSADMLLLKAKEKGRNRVELSEI
jgi:PleD family two-component response regulator